MKFNPYPLYGFKNIIHVKYFYQGNQEKNVKNDNITRKQRLLWSEERLEVY